MSKKNMDKEFGDYLRKVLKDKNISGKEAANLIIKKSGEPLSPEYFSQLLGGTNNWYLNYTCQILKNIDRAIYIDGDNLFELPKNLNIEQLLKDSNALKKILEIASKHHHGENPKSKVKKITKA